MSKNKLNLEMQTIEEKDDAKNEYKEVSLFKNPIIILLTSLKMLIEQITKSIKFFLTNKKILIILILISLSLFFNGPHKSVRKTYKNLKEKKILLKKI